MKHTLLNNKARNHPHYSTAQQFLEKIDHLREYFLPVTYLEPKKLFTENRLDIKYRGIEQDYICLILMVN